MRCRDISNSGDTVGDVINYMTSRLLPRVEVLGIRYAVLSPDFVP